MHLSCTSDRTTPKSDIREICVICEICGFPVRFPAAAKRPPVAGAVLRRPPLQPRLDARFSNGRIDESLLQASVEKIAQVQGHLRVVADGAERQLEAASRWRIAMRDVWPRPPFTLIPIAPQRLAEKQARSDHFFKTLLDEGVLLAAED